MAKTRDMTVGSPARLILSFCLPIAAGNLLQQFYNIVDTLVIGRGEGVAALAAVSGSGWLDWGILSIAMGLAQGFGIQIAQSFGAGHPEEVKRYEGQSIFLSVLIVLILETLSQVFLFPALRLLRFPEDTIHLTHTYLRIVFAGIPVVMGYNLLSGFLYAVGNSRTPLLALSVATVINIVLDMFLVITLRLGVIGAAVATVSSQCISFLICLIAVCRLPVFHIRRHHLQPEKQAVIRLLRLNAASRLQGMLELFGTAVGNAMGTFAGQNFGAKRLDRVRIGLRQSAKIAFGMALVITLLMFLFGRQLLALFVEDDPAVVEQVLVYAFRFLRVMASGLPCLYLLFVYRSTLQGLGDTFIPMISGVVELLMRILCALLLPALIGEWGVYFAEIAAWIGAAVLLMIGYYHRLHLLERSLRTENE